MISDILNGTTHSIPEVDETDWGEEVTALLQDLIAVLDGTFQSIIASGATTNVNFNNGKNIDLTLNASTTLVFSNARVGRPAVFQISQGGNYTITWPANVKWRGAHAPVITTGAGKMDVVCLLYNSSRNIYTGEYAQDFA